jgi:23S rRNA maturation-related 3'-5' exoribonuclease YhaM
LYLLSHIASRNNQVSKMESKTQAQEDASITTWWQHEELQGRPKKEFEEIS